MSTENTPNVPTNEEAWRRRVLEHKAGLFAVLTTIAVSIGGVVEIAPMYAIPADPDAPALAPYTPLETAGRLPFDDCPPGGPFSKSSSGTVSPSPRLSPNGGPR